MKKNDVRNFVVATFLLMVVSLLMIPSKVMAQGKYFKAAIEAGREKGKPYCATQINGTGWEIKGSSHSMSSVLNYCKKHKYVILRYTTIEKSRPGWTSATMPDNVWFIPESELADYEQQPEAIYDKALRLEKGDYCDQNVDEALTWYRKAEALGFYKAKYALGRLYHFGIGVQKDENKAIEYLTDFIEGCKSYDELKFMKIMLTDDILYKKRPTMGATYYLRTDLADKNLAAMYAADILTYKIKVKEFKEWEPYERSYIKGYPKARERVAQLYKEKDVWVSSFVRREQNDNKRMDELYKKMQDVVAAKEFVLASDSGVTDIKNYIRRYAKCVWPARMDAKIDKMNQFYHVIAWARIDINKKWYGTGFLAALAGADDYNNDIEEISYLIKICKEEKDSAYKKLRAEVETHRNGAEPSDDLTMMCLYIAQ